MPQKDIERLNYLLSEMNKRELTQEEKEEVVILEREEDYYNEFAI